MSEEELAAAGGPTFESVSRHFPPMKWPRKVVGALHASLKIGKIRLRLRHPEGLPIRLVKAPAGVSAETKGDQVTLSPARQPVELKLAF